MIEHIILDRDGVINFDSDAYIKSPQEWLPIPGSLEAMAKAYHAGKKLYVATNQSGLARKLFDQDNLDQIFAKMTTMLAELDAKLEAIVYCPHLPDANCGCRKPKIGLLTQLQEQHQVDLSKAVFIGDSLKDLQAAWQTPAEGILVKTGNGTKTLAKNKDQLQKTKVYPNLAHAIDAILNENHATTN